MDIEIIKNDLKAKVSEKRYRHSESVSKTALYLSEIYGANKEDAALSGWLHDILKELPLGEMQKLTQNLDLDEEVFVNSSLLHAPAGAVYAKNKYAVNDDVYNACFYHTFGRCGMSLLEKIIFVSDMTEETRDFDGVENLRKIAEENIDKAVVACINQTLGFLMAKDRIIYEKTVNVRNFYLKNMENF